jgi:hypothetical protein
MTQETERFSAETAGAAQGARELRFRRLDAGRPFSALPLRSAPD